MPEIVWLNTIKQKEKRYLIDMKKKVILISAISVVIAFLATSCFDEKFTDDPSHVLSFSTDIVKFDTIFTDKGTATLSFRVYNRNNRAVRIESVRLADAEHSGFHINVDGEKGPEAGPIELSAQDSLYVFVEANIDPTDVSTPFLVKDSIVFLTNGVKQDVKIEAYGQNAVVFRGGKIISTDTTFTDKRPFLIYDSLVVASNATLSLTAGTTLYLHDKAFVRIDGRMRAQGTASKRVTLRGDRTDNVFPDLPYDFYSGQWGGVQFGPESYENLWEYVDMHGSSWGIRIDSSDISRDKLTLQHSIVHNSASHLISASHARINGYNCQLTNAGGALLHLTACRSEWIHCTVANLYNWDVISTPALTLLEYSPADSVAPEMQPRFLIANSIVTTRGLFMAPSEIEGLNISFDNCLFQVNGEDDENFLSCIWEKDPAFVATGDNYIFDFRITESSPAREAGSTAYLNDTTAVDLYGIPRPTDGTRPDIGASNYTQPSQDDAL